MADYDFLSMCQHVSADAGIAGTITNVTQVTGDQARIVRFVRKQCLAIEQRWGDWKFSYASGLSTPLAVGLNTYSPPDNLRRWNKDRMYIDGRKVPKCNVMEYHEWNGVPIESDGYPTFIIIMPDGSLMFEPAPVQAMTFTADYYKSAKILSANTDIPNVPQHLCPVIEAFALQEYAQYDSSEELMAKAASDIEIWNNLLENDQRPGGEYNDTSYGNDLVTNYY